MEKDIEKSTIEDIYSGELIEVWKDNERVFVSFYPNDCTLSFQADDWEKIKMEMQDIIKQID